MPHDLYIKGHGMCCGKVPINYLLLLIKKLIGFLLRLKVKKLFDIQYNKCVYLCSVIVHVQNTCASNCQFVNNHSEHVIRFHIILLHVADNYEHCMHSGNKVGFTCLI